LEANELEKTLTQPKLMETFVNRSLTYY